MANKGWDDPTATDQRFDQGGKHDLSPRQARAMSGETTKVSHMTSLKEQFQNGGEWNTELPVPGKKVPTSPYRAGVIAGANDGVNVAAYDGIYGP